MFGGFAGEFLMGFVCLVLCLVLLVCLLVSPELLTESNPAAARFAQVRFHFCQIHKEKFAWALANEPRAAQRRTRSEEQRGPAGLGSAAEVWPGSAATARHGGKGTAEKHPLRI